MNIMSELILNEYNIANSQILPFLLLRNVCDFLSGFVCLTIEGSEILKRKKKDIKLGAQVVNSVILLH